MCNLSFMAKSHTPSGFLKKTVFALLWYMVGTLSVLAQGSTLLPIDDRIKDGNVHLSDIPFFIHFIASYLVGIAGTVSVLMVMVGGYQWILGGVSEDQKGKAKKTISYAIMGLVITLLSWIIVNVVQVNLAS